MSMTGYRKTIEFLDEPKDGINHKAWLVRDMNKPTRWFVENGNMPFIGTLNYILSEDEIADIIADGRAIVTDFL